MNTFWMIFIAATVSLSLRAIPLVLLKFFHFHPQHPLFVFFGYTVYGIMGGIIYTTCFPKSSWHLFFSPNALLPWLKVLLLSAALILGCYWRNLTALVLMFVGLYAGILVFFQGVLY